MKIKYIPCFLVLPLLLATLSSGCASANQPVRRVGMVIGIRPDKIPEYEQLHADSNPGVRDLLTKYHMHNFSIFMQQIDDKWYEFGYWEYTGDDFDGDMAKLDAEPRNIEWLKVCDPLQIPLSGAKGWTKMKRVYFNP
ncbi:MAG: L-rhamnose mutarotase [Verrucomicrobiota bacterium]|jgi:L-rhamnose mutarotase